MSTSVDDNQVIENVLFGKIGTEVLVPCSLAPAKENANELLFESGPFSLSEDQIEDGSFVEPESLCLNCRSLNWYTRADNDKDYRYAAFVVAGPYKLDERKKYFVDSFVFQRLCAAESSATIGLYAHVGPYLVQIACSAVSRTEQDMTLVNSGINFKFLEQVCLVPSNASALEVIVHGNFDTYYGQFRYEKMKLSLSVFDIEC